MTPPCWSGVNELSYRALVWLTYRLGATVALGLPTVLAILLFVLYYVVTIMGERMVRSGALSPAWGMWLGTLVMIPTAILLNLRAAREMTWRPLSRTRNAG